MAPTCKLTYFNVTALAEPMRFLLNYGGIDFEDVRIKSEEWPQCKPKTPMGQLPMFEKDGKVAHQSLAITRYIAKQVKLVGKNDWEDLEIDAAVDTVSDMRMKMVKYHYEADEKVKESLKEPLFKEILPYYLERLDAIAKSNNGHLAVGRLTWADFYFAGILGYLNYIVKGDLIEKYPNLQAVKKNVVELAPVKAYIAKRPATDF